MPTVIKTRISRILIGILAIFALVAALVGYALLHKPFTPDQLISLFRVFSNIFIAATFIILAGGIGHKISSRCNLAPGLDTAAVEAGLGLGILALLFFLLGISVGFNTWYTAITLLIIAFVTKQDIKSWINNWRINSQLAIPSDYLQRTIAILVIAIAFSNLLIASAPPLAFDALTYHLSLPKYYLEAGRFIYTPEIIFWGMPQLTEILYTACMTISDAQSAALLGWGIGMLTLLGLHNYVSSKFNQAAGWAAVATLLAGWTLSDTMSRAYVEWSAMLFGLAALISLDLWLRQRNSGLLILAGAFSGFALSTKYSAGIILLSGLAVIIFLGKQKRIRNVIVCLIAFTSAAILVMLPWLTKNLLATNNPFYPLFFPSGDMDQIRISFYQGSQKWFNWIDMLSLPIQATIWGEDGSKSFSASIGPLLLGFSAFAWLDWQNRSGLQRNTIKTSLVFCVLGFLSWALGSRLTGLLIQSRLYFSFFPAWAVLAASGFDALSHYSIPHIRVGRIASVILLISLGFNSFETISSLIQRDTLKVVLGVITPDEYIYKNLGSYQGAMKTINELPPTAKVLMLWETRGYYCLPYCDSDEIIDTFRHDIRVYKEPNAVLSHWIDQGYTHILINHFAADFIRSDDLLRYTPDDWRKLDETISILGVSIAGGNTMYELFDIGNLK